jgi:hypothetical protein
MDEMMIATNPSGLLWFSSQRVAGLFSVLPNLL